MTERKTHNNWKKKTALGHAFVEWPLSQQNYLHDKQHMHTDYLIHDTFWTTLSTTPVLIWMHGVPMRFTRCSCIWCFGTETRCKKRRNVVAVMLTCCKTMSCTAHAGFKTQSHRFHHACHVPTWDWRSNILLTCVKTPRKRETTQNSFILRHNELCHNAQTWR